MAQPPLLENGGEWPPLAKPTHSPPPRVAPRLRALWVTEMRKSPGYYEIYGTGAQTLTLIRGLGADLSTWFPQIPELSKHFRTDTNCLLEALNIRRTALLGISMGGMIAEEFAIHFPDKSSSPILGCTTFGGSESVPFKQENLEAILAGADADEKTRQLQERAIARRRQFGGTIPRAALVKSRRQL